MGNHDWDNNLAKVFLGFFRLLKEFKVVVSIIVLGAAITLGVFDVPVFEAIVGGLVRMAQALIPGIGG